MPTRSDQFLITEKLLLQHRGLEEYLSIDESMIPYNGKHYAKQFIRGKPIHFGFKMWALCSKYGFLHWFGLYLGKNVTDGRERSERNVGLGCNVVLKLIEKASVPRDQGHKVYFDNYFTSIQLIEDCQKKNCASGTCRENRTTKCPMPSKSESKKFQRGYTTSEQLTI